MSGFLYGILLLSYTGYALLDSFVIPHPMQTVVASSQQSNSQSTLAESVEAQINQKLNSTEAESSAQVSDPTELNQTETQTDASTSSSLEGTAIGNYSDSKTKITLTKYRSYDSSIYVADVTVSDVSVLKTAFAQNTYGRNITEQTSSIASDHQAVLAINGDYYGARQSGYVIRNGQYIETVPAVTRRLPFCQTAIFSLSQRGKLLRIPFCRMVPCRSFPSARFF